MVEGERSTVVEAKTLRMLYFSGTGNARNVAHWIAAVWKEQHLAATVTDLSRVEPASVVLGPDEVLGLVSPTHGFNYPPITVRFVARLPRAAHKNSAFLLNTRAGARLFGLCLPGLSGIALWLAALLLRLKGYRIVGMRSIDLPSNWVSLHPGLREDNVRALYERCERIARRFALRMVQGRRDYRACWDLPLDAAIAPIALGYHLIGRFFFAKSFVASRHCDGCGACAKQCPVQAIRFIGGRPFWTYHCESCMACMNQCPKRAIETAHGFIVGFPVLLSMALTAWVYPHLRLIYPALFAPGTVPKGILFAAESALMVGLLFGLYRLLHWGMRLPLVERLVILTSLTHLRWWRRYRAPRR